jgi:hypothetical protein
MTGKIPSARQCCAFPVLHAHQALRDIGTGPGHGLQHAGHRHRLAVRVAILRADAQRALRGPRRIQHQRRAGEGNAASGRLRPGGGGEAFAAQLAVHVGHERIDEACARRQGKTRFEGRPRRAGHAVT